MRVVLDYFWASCCASACPRLTPPTTWWRTRFDFATRRALQTNIHGPRVDPNDRKAVRAAAAKALRDDPALTALMNSAIRYSPTVFDVAIADSEGRALLVPTPTTWTTCCPTARNTRSWPAVACCACCKSSLDRLAVYNVTLPVERDSEPFATVRVGVRTTFLRFVVEPWLIAALTYTGVAIVCSLIFAAFLANLALKPIEQIGARLDALAVAEAEVAGETASGHSGDAVVRSRTRLSASGAACATWKRCSPLSKRTSIRS